MLTGVLGTTSCEEPLAPEASGLPNVVLIIVDDLRWDAIDVLEAAGVPTPSLDRLSNEGITFDQAFVVQSVCAPSRASMFTGVYPHSHGVRSNGQAWKRNQRNIFREMAARGYLVGYVGKWHVDAARRPAWADRWVSFPGQGAYFDQVLNVDGRRVPSTGHITDVLTDYAVRFLQTTHDRSFFLVLSHVAVHQPWEPQDAWKGTVAQASLTVPVSFYDDLSDQPPFLANRVLTWSESQLRHNMEAYYEVARGVDESVGRVVATLEQTGRLDDTMIILVGDNGYLLGEHRLRDKRVAFEESIRIPLIVRYPPWFAGGMHSEGFALNIDLPATILQVATGQTWSFGYTRVDQSLKLTADGAHRPAFLYEYFLDPTFPETPGMRAVRTNRYKYVRYDDPRQIDELYDLQADPYEMRNLISDERYSGVLDTLREELARLRVESGDP